MVVKKKRDLARLLLNTTVGAVIDVIGEKTRK